MLNRPSSLRAWPNWFHNGWPRIAQSPPRSRALAHQENPMNVRLVIAAAALLFAACGGGGSDTTPATPEPPSDPNAFPSALPAPGDWFVYTSSVNPTLPAGTAATERTFTRHFRVVNSDRSLTRADTTSTFNSLASRAFYSAGALVSYTSGTLLCNYAPAYRSIPPYTSSVGDSYSGTSSESCATQPNGAATVLTLSTNGVNQPVENKTIPLGTFSTFKYIQTLTTSSTADVRTSLETCWIDRNTGRTVECTSTYTTVPVGQSTATASGTTIFRLEGYSFNGRAPVGAAVRRFSGYWNLVYGGTSSGDCLNLLIDVNGQISGGCRVFPTLSNAPAFAVSGTINAAGTANLVATTGATISGSFTSPAAASGTWTNGAASGTWIATHI